jgi:hypothetical protein
VVPRRPWRREISRRRRVHRRERGRPGVGLSKAAGRPGGNVMALRQCRECGAMVSTRARVCPRCGINRPGKSRSWIEYVFASLGFIVIGLVIVGSLSRTPPATTADAPQSSRGQSALYSLTHPSDPASTPAPSDMPEQRALDGTEVKPATHLAQSSAPLSVEFSIPASVKANTIEGRTNLPNGTRLFSD